MSKADLIIHGGSIVSMDDVKPSPEAIAVRDGKIIAVGIKSDVLKLGDKETEYVELKGKETLLPGFIEPHQHATQMIFNRCLYVNCGAYYYETYDEIKNLIQTTVDKTDPASGKWCLFLGWDPEMIPTLPKLDFSVMDSFSKDVPILIIGQSGHVGWGNNKAFKLAEIPADIQDPEGGVFVRDAAGNLTGQMLESPAMMMVMKNAPLPTPEELSKALDEQWMEYAKCGFTTVTDLAYMPTDVDSLVQQKASFPDCPLRLALYTLKYGPGEDVSKCKEKSCCKLSNPKKRGARAIPPNLQNDKLWFAGIKICADGSPHCGTAAVREPYLDTDLTRLLCFPPSPCYGTLNYDDEAVLETVRYWHDQGYQIAAHAHGERAIEQVLSAYQQVMDESKDQDRRHRIEHLGLCDENHIKSASKLNLAFSFFVEHLFFYAKAYSESIFGEKRTARWTPLSLASKHNLRWTIHQDHPTFPLPPEPLVNMKTAVTRTRKGEPGVVYGKEYCVPIEDALKAYTINAAWQIHKEKELGSLTVGKRADFVILSDNPLKVDPFKLGDIKVVNTYLDGQSNKLNQ